MDLDYLNKLFRKLIKSKKYSEDKGIIPPAYKKKSEAPLYEECFVLEFLKRLGDEYKDIEFHDIQIKTGKHDPNSMDLICRKARIGVEVVQGIDSNFRKEESKWNKPLCKGEDTELEHEWINQPTSLNTIYERIGDKNSKYYKYKKDYNYIDDIDLFVYVLDAKIEDINVLVGKLDNEHICFSLGANFGYPANEILSKYGLQPILKDLQTPYRKIYIVFANYWYYFERDKDFEPENCTFKIKHSKDVTSKAINLQNITEIK